LDEERLTSPVLSSAQLSSSLAFALANVVERNSPFDDRGKLKNFVSGASPPKLKPISPF
jgi:hypothetical protein